MGDASDGGGGGGGGVWEKDNIFDRQSDVRVINRGINPWMETQNDSNTFRWKCSQCV